MISLHGTEHPPQSWKSSHPFKLLPRTFCWRHCWFHGLTACLPGLQAVLFSFLALCLINVNSGIKAGYLFNPLKSALITLFARAQQTNGTINKKLMKSNFHLRVLQNRFRMVNKTLVTMVWVESQDIPVLQFCFMLGHGMISEWCCVTTEVVQYCGWIQ